MKAFRFIVKQFSGGDKFCLASTVTSADQPLATLNAGVNSIQLCQRFKSIGEFIQCLVRRLEINRVENNFQLLVGHSVAARNCFGDLASGDDIGRLKQSSNRHSCLLELAKDFCVKKIRDIVPSFSIELIIKGLRRVQDHYYLALVIQELFFKRCLFGTKTMVCRLKAACQGFEKPQRRHNGAFYLKLCRKFVNIHLIIVATFCQSISFTHLFYREPSRQNGSDASNQRLKIKDVISNAALICRVLAFSPATANEAIRLLKIQKNHHHNRYENGRSDVRGVISTLWTILLHVRPRAPIETLFIYPPSIEEAKV
jgi:hypothetical protein